MPLGIEVGLSPGDVVLDGDPDPPPQKGGGDPLTNFWPMSIVANGWMDQDGTWRGGEPWSRLHCARWGPSSHPHKGGGLSFYLSSFVPSFFIYLKEKAVSLSISLVKESTIFYAVDA